MCLKCGKANHWESVLVCRSNKRKQSSQGTKLTSKNTIQAIEEMSHDNDDEVLTISTIKINAMEGVSFDTHNEAFTILELSKKKINLQCKGDTGTQSNRLTNI